MIKEAIEKIVELVKGGETIQTIHETEREIRKVTTGVNGKDFVLKKDFFERNHTFTTVKGLVDYLGGPFAKGDTGPIFVEGQLVRVPLQYQKAHATHAAVLPLQESEEYKALQTLFKAIGQKDLWRRLITDLADCMPPELALNISGIKVENKGNLEVQIDVSGVTRSAANAGYQIGFNDSKGGPQTASLPLDYVAKVRIWECFDTVYEIPLRLELQATDNGLIFTFHPRRLEAILRRARAEFVEYLAEQIKGASLADRFQVIEGRN